MTINPILQFILDELHGNTEIVELTDNKFYVGLLRDPVTLTEPHYTRLGIEYVSDNGDSAFFSQIRDWDEKQVQIKITIVTSYGHNENHCRQVVEDICELFSWHRKRTTSEYKIYINKITSNLVETEQARWIGTISMDVSYLTPILVTQE